MHEFPLLVSWPQRVYIYNTIVLDKDVLLKVLSIGPSGDDIQVHGNVCLRKTCEYQ